MSLDYNEKHIGKNPLTEEFFIAIDKRGLTKSALDFYVIKRFQMIC